MIGFIGRKIGYGLLVMLGVITAVFLLFNLLPGDPAAVILGPRASQAAVDAVHHDLGTDKPLAVRYIAYLNDLSPVSAHDYEHDKSFVYLDPAKYSWTPLFTAGRFAVVLKVPYLRRSYVTRRNVSDVIGATLPETIVLAVAAMAFASFIGILLGIYCAMNKDRWVDKAVFLLTTVFGMSAPSFFVGLIVAWLFGHELAAYTGLHPTGSLYELDTWRGTVMRPANLILPALTLGIRPLSIIVQLTRSSMLDVLSQDFVRTAKAKGLSRTTVVFRHALRNALNPVVTAISGWFASLLAGAVFVEKIFNWKGIGNEVVEALNNNDLPVVMGATIVFAAIFVLITIAVDILYGVLDPRVRLQ